MMRDFSFYMSMRHQGKGLAQGHPTRKWLSPHLNLGLITNALAVLNLRELRGGGLQPWSLPKEEELCTLPLSAEGESPSFLPSVGSPTLAGAELTGWF